MTDNTTPIATLFDRAEDYGKTTLNLLKLSAIDKSADLLSSLISRLAVVIIVVLSVIFISTGVSIWIGRMVGSIFYGFLIVGGFYAFIAILHHLFFRRWLKNCVSNSIIKLIMKPKQHEE